jgi:hypothetical protein
MSAWGHRHGNEASSRSCDVAMLRLLPLLGGRCDSQYFGDARAGTGGGVVRQVIKGKETASNDLMVGFGRRVLPEGPDDEDGDMVPLRYVPVKENPMQLRRAGQHDVALLAKFAD